MERKKDSSHMSKDSSTMSIDEQIARLEELVRDSDSGDNNLDSSIKAFEQGLELAKKCMDSLTKQRGKITVLKKEADKLMESEWNE